MLNACKVKGNPEPECKIYEKSISLVLKPSEKYMLHVGQLYGRRINNIQRNTDVVDVVDKTDNVVNDSNEKHALNAHDKLLELIFANSSISIAELAMITAVTKRTVNRDLSWLKEQGYL